MKSSKDCLAVFATDGLVPIGTELTHPAANVRQERKHVPFAATFCPATPGVEGPLGYGETPVAVKQGGEGATGVSQSLGEHDKVGDLGAVRWRWALHCFTWRPEASNKLGSGADEPMFVGCNIEQVK